MKIKIIEFKRPGAKKVEHDLEVSDQKVLDKYKLLTALGGRIAYEKLLDNVIYVFIDNERMGDFANALIFSEEDSGKTVEKMLQFEFDKEEFEFWANGEFDE